MRSYELLGVRRRGGHSVRVLHAQTRGSPTPARESPQTCQGAHAQRRASSARVRQRNGASVGCCSQPLQLQQRRPRRQPSRVLAALPLLAAAMQSTNRTLATPSRKAWERGSAAPVLLRQQRAQQRLQQVVQTRGQPPPQCLAQKPLHHPSRTRLELGYEPALGHEAWRDMPGKQADSPTLERTFGAPLATTRFSATAASTSSSEAARVASITYV